MIIFKITRKSLYFLIPFIISTFSSHGAENEKGKLKIAGWVYFQEKPLPGAEVTVMQGQKNIATYKTNHNGRFIIEIPIGSIFTLDISSPGLVGKQIMFNTQLYYEQESRFDFDFAFVMDLFEPLPWIDKSFLQYPLITISFNENLFEFSYDQAEYQYLRAKLDWINLIASNYENRGQEYRNLLADAESYFRDSDYEAAFRILSQGAGIFESDTFLLNRFSIVEQALHKSQLANRANIADNQAVMPGAYQLLPEDDGKIVFKSDEKANESINIVSAAQTYIQKPALLFFSALAPFHQFNINLRVFFSVQVLASVNKPCTTFFSPVIASLPDYPILFYRDTDNLNKFTVGVFTDISEAIDTVRRLRDLRYDTHIVAFAYGQRVMVNKALSLN